MDDLERYFDALLENQREMIKELREIHGFFSGLISVGLILAIIFIVLQLADWIQLL